MAAAVDQYGTSSGPSSWAESVTPSDTVDVQSVSRAVYVGGGGDLRVVMYPSANQITFTQVPSGTVLPIRISRVMATGTSATNVVSLA